MVIVVTGASRGLGAGLVARWTAGGAAVAACARSRPPEWDEPAPDGVLAGSIDVTDAEAVAGFAEQVQSRMGPIDLWVNNAGAIEPIDLVHDVDPASVMDLLAVNVGGVLAGSQAFVRHRRAVGGGGVLVNISSGAGRKPYAGWGAYCASKAAVDRLSECIALEEAAHGLRVHSVAPGVIDTDMQAAIRSTPAERFPDVDRFHALKRDDGFAAPSAIADWILALAFDPAAATEDVLLRVPT